MTESKISFPCQLMLVLLFFFPLPLRAEVKLSQAIELGRTKLTRLMQQSQYYRLEYDTIIALPVHSETAETGDFYLLYFIYKKQFQMEMELDRQTGQATILAVGRMSPPYTELPDGTFNYRCFCPDSLLKKGSYQVRPEQDSIRLVYMGVVPKLGKRGVVWQRFLGGQVDYISLDGLPFASEDFVKNGDSTGQDISPHKD